MKKTGIRGPESVVKRMKVIRKRFAEGAGEAEGTVVIIDVFRAFSCEPLFFHFGAERVFLEARPREAMRLKREHPDWILVGEQNEVPLPGADLGNSPSEVILKGESFFRGRTVLHRTTAGVRGVFAAIDTADEVLLGSYLTAAATAGYIHEISPGVVTLVAMGDRAERPAPEDDACADYIEHLLTGRSYDPLQAIKDILYQPTAQKFILGTRSYLPREDPTICLQRDLFDFALTARRADERIRVFPVKGRGIKRPACIL
ncbi:MAG: 2-phosphosulfolactate phosphatase [Deltaproteobacteria bacterium]|nr:2-phosphosulfolactate phosphatase [Deltaproteobacteria bacterium]MBW2129372.1 2-phosphosulfolactate phosphatase [Deltaproteobacteria bacterium]